MKNIEITDEAHRLVRGEAIYEFKETGRKLTNGNWSVPFEEETIEILKANALEGESYSDTIIRIISLSRSGVN